MERALLHRLSYSFSSPSSPSSSSSSSSASSVAVAWAITPTHCVVNHHLPVRPTARFHKWLTSRFPPPPPAQPSSFSSYAFPSLATWCPKHSSIWAARTACISSSAIFPSSTGDGNYGSGGGSDGGDKGGNNGGDGSSAHSGDPEAVGSNPASSSSSSEEVIFLDVGGMSCGGCASNVKRILESQAYVIQASVNLATEAAVVRISLVSEIPSASTKKEVGEALAKHLSSCGYKSSVREEPIGV